MRRLGCLCALSLLFGLAASAQDAPKADVYLGYAYLQQTYGGILNNMNLNGGIGQVAFYPTRNVGIVGEFGGYEVRNIMGVPASGAEISYMAGPRLTTSHGPLRFYVQALAGAAHLTNAYHAELGSASANSLAVALGGGVDWNVGHHFAVRLGQLDFYITRFDDGGGGGEFTPNRFIQGSFRYTGGIVFKF
jgi:hypothetical protein